MPTGVERQPPVAASAAGTAAAGQHIKPSHFWSSSFAPPSDYWDHSQSHSLLEIETLSVSDPRGAGYASLPPASVRPAQTLERASKSSSLKRLCGKGVTRMGSYLETLHRSARIADIPESAEEGSEEVAGAEGTPVRAPPPPRVTGRRQGRAPLRTAFGGVADGPPAVPAGGGSPTGQEPSSSDESSEDNSQGAGRSPVPSSHIYIDMPPRRWSAPAWNCASGSEPESEGRPGVRRRPPPCSAGLLRPCSCRARHCAAAAAELDPWDHRAIEYVMVPKSQYLSLYRANRLLRDPCCCQGLGRASKLCDNCLRPTVLLRSPSPASAAGVGGSGGGSGGITSDAAGSTSSSGVSSIHGRRTAAPAPAPAQRAQTLLPRLTKSQPAGKKAARHTRFSSQELLLDYDSDQQVLRREPPVREKAHSSRAGIVLAGNCHVPLDSGSGTTLRRGPMKLDYTDSWRSLSRNTSSPAGSCGGSR
ncbi:uncharacterized protein LOC122380325 [Amphibalanus amphitrite]|uniref:uncharacterized protein LOC122380325 n=1 Tax=Amphibalanus amphitrite TaxID=1232801 RepID=UPI001C9263A6|nr:uncharacterized protein LOC122380325 [Amphibalanus amphitrite]